MPIEPLPYKAGGNSTALLVCDDCGAKHEILCAYTGKHNAKTNLRKLNAGQAKSKAMHLGWSLVRNNLRCPLCEEKRKSDNMKQDTVTKLHQAVPERTVSKRERIEIFTMLAEVYDIDAGHYRNGDTDDSVADVLGVMPGWVAEIREAEFGPDGSNDEMAKLSEAFEQSRTAFRDLLSQIEVIGDDLTRIKTEMKAQKERLDSATAKLASIKSALSPRITKASGVK